MNKHNKNIPRIGSVITLWFAITFVYAQAPDILWTKTYGGAADDMGYSVQQTTDGGFVITGWTRSYGSGDFNVYLIKTDADGNTQWEKTYGGPDEDIGWSVMQTADEGYIVAGYTCSFGHGDADMYVIKTDSIGDTLWTNIYGGDKTESGFTLEGASDGGFVIAGRTLSFGAGHDDIYLIKIDSLGNLIWEKTYGGSAWDVAYSIRKLPDGGYIIAGYTTSYGVGGQDVYVVRTDSNGDSLWSRTYGGGVHDLASHVESAVDSGYIMIGYTESFGATYGDYYLVRTDKDGDTLWTRHYGGDYTEWGYSVQQVDDSSYVLVGWTDSYVSSGSGIYFMKVNAFGDILWTQIYGGDSNDAAFDMKITSDSGYIIVGSTRSFGAGGDDVYLIRTKPDTLGIKEQKIIPITNSDFSTTIISAPLLLPEGRKCRIFNITGRVVAPDKMRPGIYFIEIDGKITNKVVKVR